MYTYKFFYIFSIFHFKVYNLHYYIYIIFILFILFIFIIILICIIFNIKLKNANISNIIFLSENIYLKSKFKNPTNKMYKHKIYFIYVMYI